MNNTIIDFGASKIDGVVLRPEQFDAVVAEILRQQAKKRAESVKSGTTVFSGHRSASHASDIFVDKIGSEERIRLFYIFETEMGGAHHTTYQARSSYNLRFVSWVYAYAPELYAKYWPESIEAAIARYNYRYNTKEGTHKRRTEVLKRITK